METTWIHILGPAVAVYLVVMAAFVIFQKRFLYRPSRRVRHTPAELGLEYDNLHLTAADRIRLHAWYLPCREARATVLFCHGNKGNIGDRLESVKLFQKLGLNALLFDYRGYGESEGIPGEQGTYRDAEACWKYLTEERGVPAESLFLFGRSLGAAVAIHLAARKPCAGLIAESTFTSFPEIGAVRFPWLPVKLFSRYRYDSLREIRNVRVPVLIAHSPDDELIPFTHAERLHEAANEPKFFTRLTGGHAKGFVLSGQSYEKALGAFIAKALG